MFGLAKVILLATMIALSAVIGVGTGTVQADEFGNRARVGATMSVAAPLASVSASGRVTAQCIRGFGTDQLIVGLPWTQSSANQNAFAYGWIHRRLSTERVFSNIGIAAIDGFGAAWQVSTSRWSNTWNSFQTGRSLGTSQVYTSPTTFQSAQYAVLYAVQWADGQVRWQWSDIATC